VNEAEHQAAGSLGTTRRCWGWQKQQLRAVREQGAVAGRPAH
jgi:hypothetical protein